MNRMNKAAKAKKRRSSSDFRVLPGALVIVVLFITAMFVGYIIMALFGAVPMPSFLRSLFSSQDGDGDELSALEMVIGGKRFDFDNTAEITLGEELPKSVLVGAISTDTYLQQGVVEYIYGSSKRTFEVILIVCGDKYRAEIREDDQLKLVICDGSTIYVIENDITESSEASPDGATPERDAMIPSVKDIAVALEDAEGSVWRTDDRNILYYSSDDGKISREFRILYDGAIVLQAEYSNADGVFYSFTTLSLFTDCEFDDSAFQPSVENAPELNFINN